MGLYDTVHAGSRCGQVKCFGKGLSNFVVGDAVQLIPAPVDEASYELYASGQAPARPETDFQVAMSEGGFVLVRAGRLSDWSDLRELALPLFDTLGFPLADDAGVAVWPNTDDCEICERVRLVGAAQARVELDAQRAAQADQLAQRRAERRRAQLRIAPQ